MNQKLYTRQEITDYFKVSIYTIDNWLKSGKLKCHKMNNTVRISQTQLDNFLSNNNQETIIKTKNND
jgi:excisionase family DNA binding protein